MHASVAPPRRCKGSRAARARGRRYNWFASHTQGTFLGPLASLMQNSYSKAQLSPLGKLYTSYKSKISNAAPLPDPTSALHDHMQARPRADAPGRARPAMPKRAPGAALPWRGRAAGCAACACRRVRTPPHALHIPGQVGSSRGRQRVSAPVRRAAAGHRAGAGPTGGARARRRRCAARARRPPPTRPWSSRTSTCARCASSTAASSSERASRAACAPPHGPRARSGRHGCRVWQQSATCVSALAASPATAGGAAHWPPGARLDAATCVVVSWAKKCGAPGSCAAGG